MITYYFPPMGTIGTLRNYIFSKEMAKYFDKVHVITISNRPYPMKDKLDCDHINMHEVRNYDYRVMNKGAAPASYKRNTRVFTFMSRLVDSYPYNLWIGEGGRIYINSALSKGKEVIKQNNISHIYSSFRPLADHYIASKLKKQFPDLFWVADFRDLHVDPVLKNVFAPERQHKANKAIISNANLLTTVSEGLAYNLESYHPNRYVLHNGIYPLFKDIDVKENKEKFTISYTGSMYGENRNPELLLKAIQSLIKEGKIQKDKIQIKYAGKDFQIWEDWVAKFDLQYLLVNCGYLSFKDSFRLQRESHINLLLTYTGNNYTGGLTGKLYEYLAAERPVFLIIKGDADHEFELLMEQSNAGILLYADDQYLDQAKSYILNLYHSWEKEGSIPFTMNQDFLKKYHWEEMVVRLLGKL